MKTHMAILSALVVTGAVLVGGSAQAVRIDPFRDGVCGDEAPSAPQLAAILARGAALGPVDLLVQRTDDGGATWNVVTGKLYRAVPVTVFNDDYVGYYSPNVVGHVAQVSLRAADAPAGGEALELSAVFPTKAALILWRNLYWDVNARIDCRLERAAGATAWTSTCRASSPSVAPRTGDVRVFEGLGAFIHDTLFERDPWAAGPEVTFRAELGSRCVRFLGADAAGAWRVGGTVELPVLDFTLPGLPSTLGALAEASYAPVGRSLLALRTALERTGVDAGTDAGRLTLLAIRPFVDLASSRWFDDVVKPGYAAALDRLRAEHGVEALADVPVASSTAAVGAAALATALEELEAVAVAAGDRSALAAGRAALGRFLARPESGLTADERAAVAAARVVAESLAGEARSTALAIYAAGLAAWLAA